MRLVSDTIWAIMTIYGEARGESFDGKIAVANVIRNRMVRKYSSDGSVPGTVLRPLQFSCWNHNDPNRGKMATLDDGDLVVQQCRQAWNTSGSVDLTEGSVLYLNKNIVHPLPTWATEAQEVVTIGAHSFYTDP